MNIADGFKGSQFVRFHSIITSTPFCFLSLILTIGNLSSCALFDHGRSVYDREGIRIGIEADPSVRPSSQGGVNNHPIDLTPTELELLLQVIQVSGYSGTMVGLITKPEPVPLFTPKELSIISRDISPRLSERRSRRNESPSRCRSRT